jgi:hypothetical protein
MTSVHQSEPKMVAARPSEAKAEGEVKSSPGLFTRVFELWETVIESLIPSGYQDETGFHYGSRN